MTHHRPFLSYTLATAAALVVGIVVFAQGTQPAAAGTAAPPAATSIALVDLASLMNGLEELKVRNQQVKVRQDGFQVELDSLRKAIEQIDAELKDVIAPTDTKARTDKLAEKFQKEALFEATVKAYQRVLDLENGDIIRDLYQKVQKSIAAFAQREGYDLVLLDDRAITLPPRATLKEYNTIIENKRILFAREGMDVTQRLITIMNNDYSASTGGAPAPEPAPSPRPPGQ